MDAISPFFPTVNFRDDSERRLRQTYVDPLVKRFFEARRVDGVPREIKPTQAITEIDFAQSRDLSFDYLYKVVMKGVRKRDGVISHIAYALTFDLAICPHTCDITGTRYGYMSLAGRPILYYILLDLPTLIDRLRQHSDLKPSYGFRYP